MPSDLEAQVPEDEPRAGMPDAAGSRPQAKRSAVPVRDYRELDRVDLSAGPAVRLLATEAYKPRPGFPDVEICTLSPVMRKIALHPLIRDLLGAVQLLARADQGSVIIANGGRRTDALACLLNDLFSWRGRTILFRGPHVETKTAWKRRMVRRMVRGSTLNVVWSRRQCHTLAEYLAIPQGKFFFLPYKANHSDERPVELSIGDYVFAGGNSGRDYRTLFAAVRGTQIPVIVSATDARVVSGLAIPENVILLSAREPAFARLMAASRFVVIPIKQGLVRGAGEGSICNAMWHGKPVICADDTSAGDYIQEGDTGHVVPAGDVAALRNRLVTLWRDRDRASEMGRRAHQAVATAYTHDHFIRRLLTLAALLAPRR